MTSLEDRMAVLLNQLEAKKPPMFKGSTHKLSAAERAKTGDVADIVARVQASRPKEFGPQQRMANAKLNAGPPKLQPSGGFGKWASKSGKGAHSAR